LIISNLKKVVADFPILPDTNGFEMKTYLIIGIIALCAGFYLGRRSVAVIETTTIEYQAMPTVSVSVAPEPLRFAVPELPQWLYFTDTITQLQVIDTSAILADWALRREYGNRLINDTTGTVDYFAVVQYNRLQNIALDYTPTQRTVTIIRTIQPRFTPFILVGANTAGFGQIEAGVLFHRWGASVELGTNFSGRNYVGGKVGVKF
jgi:LPXTG-motif cell wall-anchored protein